MRRKVLVATAVLAASVLDAQPASAEISCTLDAGVISVTSWTRPDLTIVRNGNAFRFVAQDGTSSSCGGTMTNVNTVRIERGGRITAEHVTIDLAGGGFAPGMTSEPSGTSEIEFEIDLGGCQCLISSDRLEVVGTSGEDSIRFAGGPISTPDATPGADLNADGDLDIVVENDFDALRTVVDGREGNDIVGGFIAGRLPYPTRMSVLGGPGADTVSGGGAADYVSGGDDDDTVSGGFGNDRLDESLGNDNARGGAGDDLFTEGTGLLGATAMTGGGGVDLVDYSYGPLDTVTVTVTLDGVADDGAPGEGDDAGADIENVRGGWGDDVVYGTAAANDLFGEIGNDRLYGRGGADDGDGGPGNDLVAGGTGNDVARGDAGNDRLAGAGGNDRLEGDAGDDRIRGGPGDDFLDGGEGVDSCYGGTGTNTRIECE